MTATHILLPSAFVPPGSDRAGVMHYLPPALEKLKIQESSNMYEPLTAAPK
jgi:hypothetical protein